MINDNLHVYFKVKKFTSKWKFFILLYIYRTSVYAYMYKQLKSAWRDA